MRRRSALPPAETLGLPLTTSSADDPHRHCHIGLFSDGKDNGDGTCTYKTMGGDATNPDREVTCSYDQIPNGSFTGCNARRCTTQAKLTRGALFVGGGSLVGWALARAFAPKHPVAGTVAGVVAGAAAYAVVDVGDCLFGEKMRP